MPQTVLFVCSLLAALGCGLTAGVFFAFSTFVMKALGRLPAAQGIAAMQSINITVINVWFGLLFFGTAALCLLLGGFSLLGRPVAAGWLLLGSLLHLVGTMAVTGLCNVPRNNALAPLDPDSPAAHQLWATFLPSWTFWNHVRTVAPLLAAVCFTLALCKLAQK